MNRWSNPTVVDDGAQRTLRLGGSLMRPGHAWGLIGGFLALPLLLIAVLILLLREAGEGKEEGWDLLRAAWAAFLKEPGSELMLWTVAVLTPLAVVLIALQTVARMRVTAMGLEARVPRWLGLGLFGQTAGSWEVLWDSVRRVRLVPPAGGRKGAGRLGWYRLVIETDTEEIRINPFAWFDHAGADHRLSIGELLRPGAVHAEERVLDAPLVQVIETRGFQVEITEPGFKTAGNRVDLLGHKGMVILLAVFFLAGVYTLVDTYVTGNYRALESIPVAPFIEALIVAGLGVWLLGRGAPALERAVVGGLTVITVIAAVHPAVLRVNAATAEPEIIRYRATAPGVFEAPHDWLPAIDLTDVRVDEYWAMYPPGSFHEFTLLRGKAGFYQVDLSPLYTRTSAFYESISESKSSISQ